MDGITWAAVSGMLMVSAIFALYSASLSTPYLMADEVRVFFDQPDGERPSVMG